MNNRVKELAIKLREQIIECNQTLLKINEIVQDSDNPDIKSLCLTELGDKMLGNNSIEKIVEKVIEKS